MKPNILVLSEYYLPGYHGGGTVRSVSNLVAQLEEDFSWRIITRNHDLGAAVPYPEIQADAWQPHGAADVFYASDTFLRRGGLVGLLRRTHYDLLYLNSYFSPHFSIVPQWLRWLRYIPRVPVLLAPRGEFSDGALAIKGEKKRIYRYLADCLGVYADTKWHASTEQEACQIRAALKVQPTNIHVARNLGRRSASTAEMNERAMPHTKPRAVPLKLVYLGRISRNKNLSFALQVLRHVRRPVHLSIFGPREDLVYFEECERLAYNLPDHVFVTWEGPLDPRYVRGSLEQYDLFFLPSTGENYGHALVEAWEAGLPVLTSNLTPWRELKSAGLGWDLPLDDPEPFAQVIDEVAEWPPEHRQAIRTQCAAHGWRLTNDPAALDANRRIFHANARFP